MKRTILILVLAAFFVGCGSKGKSAKKLAEDVCDCTKKANAMEASDPKRSGAQADCLSKQGKAWADVKDDPKKAEDFNAVLRDCSSEQIKNALGQ